MPSPPRLRAGLGGLALAAVALLVGCATEPTQPPPRPAEVRAQITSLMPSQVADREGWATDIYAAFAALGIEPTASKLCAVLAVTEQESTFRADPAVPNLGKIARAEIDKRAGQYGVPAFAVDLALQIRSPDGRSYEERIAAVKTERELSAIFEDFTAMVPLGSRLFGGLNPVRTGGPMQVSIGYAEALVKQRGYPYPIAGSVRHEVFTRRGGMYFGIAHLLAYPANYDSPLYRFADFNAGQYASRNAAFQNAASLASGIPLVLDGDLVRRGGDADAKPGATELAVRALGKRLGIGDAAIRRALEQGDGSDFEETAVYRRVFELAEHIERRPLPKAVVPNITLSSPKITRKLTTEWFARRVEERHKRCMARAVPAAATRETPQRLAGPAPGEAGERR
jgi:hypothetical protein